MPPVTYSAVVSFSSEDPNNPAENLLRADTFRKWKCVPGCVDKQSWVILRLDRLTPINSIDIGNDGSAFVEVLVSREGLENFQVLLVASSFMTPIESRNASDMHRVRMFSTDKLNKSVAQQKWDRVKVVCTQPFNKNLQYGLSFITVRAPGAQESAKDAQKVTKLGNFTLREEKDQDTTITIGSLFAKRKEKDSSPLTGAAAIRAASAAAASASSPASLKRKAPDPADVGFYQLKKKTTPAKEEGRPSTTQSPTVQQGQRDGRDRDKSSKDRDKERPHSKQTPKDTEKAVKKEKQQSTKKQEQRKPTEEKKRQAGGERASTSTATTPSGSRGPQDRPRRKVKPFGLLMEDVVFVMSGYQNPKRGNLRDMMLEMGAKYKGDWDPACSHLICAFTNTPKYQQVKGKGKIVTDKWVTACHKDMIRYPWRRYRLDNGSGKPESEDEIWAEEIMPEEQKVKPTSSAAAASAADYEGDTDESDNVDTDDEIERVLANKRNAEQASKEIKKENRIVENGSYAAVKEERDDQAKPSTSVKVKEENKNSTPKRKEKQEQSKFSDSVKSEKDEKPRLFSSETVKKEKHASPAVKVEREGRKGGAQENGSVAASDDEVYDDDTDVDEENLQYLQRPDTSALSLPDLKDFFKGKTFFIYGKMRDEERSQLRRYIIAFGGTVEDYMAPSVQYVVSQDSWDEQFDDALNENPSLQFVKATWVWRCSDKQKLVPHQPYLIVPSE